MPFPLWASVSTAGLLGNADTCLPRHGRSGPVYSRRSIRGESRRTCSSQPLDGQGEGPEAQWGPVDPPKVNWQECRALSPFLGPVLRPLPTPSASLRGGGPGCRSWSLHLMSSQRTRPGPAEVRGLPDPTPWPSPEGPAPLSQHCWTTCHASPCQPPWTHREGAGSGAGSRWVLSPGRPPWGPCMRPGVGGLLT